MSQYEEVLEEFDGYENYNLDISNTIKNGFYKRLKEDTVFQKFSNCSVAYIKEENLLQVRNSLREILELLKKFQDNIQYHEEHKKDFTQKVYSCSITYLDDIKKELKEKTQLNILNFNGNAYNYQDLVKKLIYGIQKSTYRVYYDNYKKKKKYYDFSKLNSYEGGKLLYLDFINKKLIDKIFNFEQRQKELRIYEKNIQTYNFGTMTIGYSGTYNFYDIWFGKKFKKAIDTASIDEKIEQFINLTKKIFYNYQYNFNANGIAIFIKDGKYGLIHKNKQVILDAKYDYIHTYMDLFKEKDFFVFLNGDSYKQGLIDFKGEILLEANYDYFYSYENGIVYVKKNEKIGLFNIKNKKMLIEPIHKKNFAHINNDLLEIEIGFRKMLMDLDGRILIPLMNLFTYELKVKKYLKNAKK